MTGILRLRLLYLDGRDLCHVALERRKEILFEMIAEGEWNLRVIDGPVITFRETDGLPG